MIANINGTATGGGFMRWMLGLVVALALTMFVDSSLASGKSAKESEIPPLRPPLEELPPTAWERHGSTFLVGCVLFLIMAGLAGWVAFRPRPVAIVPPAVEARQAVQGLSSQAESGTMLSELSRVLRRYLTAVFALPAKELTTAEFCEAIRGKPEIGPELTKSAASFLKQCDERKFSPRPPHTAMNAVGEALRIIELGETRARQTELDLNKPQAAA